MPAQHQLVDAGSGAVIVPKLELADTFWRRFRGLQLRSPLQADEGLLLKPCSSFHTHWMRFTIDVAMLDEDGVVLRVVAGIKPWRFGPMVKGTQSIVETVAGSLSERVQVGTRTAVATG